ncbi:tRNA (cytidine(34)-2'-O)-methyltransferase [Tautonia plasticadhaerens]|uniref:Putative tRNA (cytidine(34)-2'-O)-methyltransferase n=1 Tax=Tautonia plasticadhaerens TaxID=2527974 RepID=A0A518GVL0_9BACT|nr:tRNA (cytidine(34)-2'-O)-methyltransferase [Tautonia plasticadhaerens]QDV32636.1 tRNA (cytidine(34)-2'-O)-methyltransferase [Tautonia plasticadhaerens]
MPTPSVPEPAGPPPRLHVVLYQPEIAANVGAVGRTCVAIGAMLWLVRPLGFLIGDRQLKRAGLDYWEHLRWRVVDDLEEMAGCVGPDRCCWAFSTRAERAFTEAQYREGDALVFGPESRGLPGRLVEDRPDRAVRIPIRAEARSLNLSVSVAVGAFEAIRQIEAG